MRRPGATTGWLVLGVVLLAASASRRSAGSAPVRLLGPLAELGASVQWVRFQDARRRGEEERALLLAESALRLDPRTTDGWEHLARHLALFLASPEREPDPARRAAWLEAGLEVTHRGAAQADEPGRLALLRGIVLLTKAETDPDVLPGGAEALFGRAAAAFAEARAADVFGAAELERYVRER